MLGQQPYINAEKPILTPHSYRYLTASTLDNRLIQRLQRLILVRESVENPLRDPPRVAVGDEVEHRVLGQPLRGHALALGLLLEVGPDGGVDLELERDALAGLLLIGEEAGIGPLDAIRVGVAKVVADRASTQRSGSAAPFGGRSAPVRGENRHFAVAKLDIEGWRNPVVSLNGYP